MFVTRLLATCAFTLVTWQPAFAQNGPAVPSTPGPRPAASEASASPAGPQITFNSVHVDGPYIAMTFDDGPNKTLTPKLLDILAAHHIKATFFVIGENAADHQEILKRAVAEGHEIENHTWSHPNVGKMSDEAVRRELRKTDDTITAATGVHPTLFRPPYGSITSRQKHWIHDEFGYRIITWDVDPLDWKRPGASVVCNRILKETRAGSIILSHDIHPGTIEAMPATFAQLQAKGFKFVTVAELLALARPPPPKPATTPRPSAVIPAGSPQPATTPAVPNG
jgi:peptidoglycan/xylan/chitin deacetylase (PgdA/CDA1 family)